MADTKSNLIIDSTDDILTKKFVTLDSMSSYTAVLANYINSKVKIKSISFDEDTNSVIVETYDDTVTIPLTELKVDNKNIVLDALKQIALANDITVNSVTATADGKGLNWKSQELLASTTTDHKIILLFKQDTDQSNGIAVIGGELLEIGDSTYGHYEVSFTSTGSRFLKGSTTTKKKAKLVLAKYKSEYYYGIRLKSSEATNVYFAGWKNVPAALGAPDFDTYKDEDLSDIVELNDDSDTGVQVIDWIIKILIDRTWEFENGPQTITTTTETIAASSNALGNRQMTSLKLSNNNNEEIYAYFQEAKSARLYAVATNNQNYTSNGYYYIRQGSGSHWVIGIDEDSLTLKITAHVSGNSNRTLRIYKASANNRALTTTGSELYKATMTSTDQTFEVTLDKGDYVISCTGSAYYKEFNIDAVTYTADNTLSNWNQNGNNQGYDLDNDLYIGTSHNIKWYSSSIANNAGYIVATNSNTYGNPMFKLTVFAACTVTVGFCSADGDNSDVRISESETGSSDDATATSTSDSTITECTYTYNATTEKDGKTIYIFNEDGAVNFMYIKLAYFDGGETAGEAIVKVIKSLPETSETGSPHILRPQAELTKADILLIAHNLLNQKVQIALDLSNCTVASDATNWRDDTDLNKAFQGNNSLREFYYPQGVQYAGGMTFLNCAFLEKIVFSDSITAIGTGTSWTSANTGYLSGCKCSEIFLPKNLNNDWGGYFFAQNNCLKYFFYPYNKMFKNGVLPSSFNWIWNTFSLARGDFKFMLPSHKISEDEWATEDSNGECYNTWKNVSKSFANTINVSLSDVMTNVDPLTNSDNWTEFVEPYDVNEYFTSDQLEELSNED